MTYLSLFLTALAGLTVGYAYSRYLRYRSDPIAGADTPAGYTLKELMMFYWSQAPERAQEIQADIEARTAAVDAVMQRRVWIAGATGLHKATGFFTARLDGEEALVIEANATGREEGA